LSKPDDHGFRTCQFQPWWLEDAPLRGLQQTALLPRAVLVVVGSGYTGLAAALQAAEGGMSVLVLDSSPLGSGCSTRNGGQVSSSLKPRLTKLAARHGADVARAIRAEGWAALDHLPKLLSHYQIDADWRRQGRYCAAHTPRAFDDLRRWADQSVRDGEPEMQIVPKADQLGELGSDRYHGGVVYPSYGSVHPAKLHAGLLAAAERAGVTAIGQCGVQAIARDGTGFSVTTPNGTVKARHVLIATNGYTGPLSPWHRRRVIPIASSMLATAPMDEARCAALIPRDRMVVDSRNVVIYFRRSPDGRRILFGGRASISETDPARSLPRLHQMLLDVFPQLDDVPVSHSWNGLVAYTFDELPHIGVQDGVHYCMGYCGSGVSLSLYYGMRAGQKILGNASGVTALDGIPFQTRPMYFGKPWFLKPTFVYYRIKDRYFT
jgi:glycine/D-amino acid oxidase-like deaminating enzyme